MRALASAILLVALAANFVAVPLLGWGIGELLSLDEGLAIGLTIMATAAGAPFLPKLAAAAEGDLAFSVGLMVLLMVVTVVYMPLVLPLLISGVEVDPWAIASSWLVLAMVNLWAGGHVTRLSGRLVRPWPDLSALMLPGWMALAFAAAVLASMLPDMAGLVASGFASAFMFAFMLLGLAILHGVTRGSAARPMMLGLVYLSLLFLSPISSMAVAMVGLAEPLLRRRRPPPVGT